MHQHVHIHREGGGERMGNKLKKKVAKKAEGDTEEKN